MPEPYEPVYSPLFVPKGTAYRIDRGVYEPGRSVAMVFHDEADHLLWKENPEKWAGPAAPAALALLAERGADDAP